MTRRLSLRAESLAELTTEELSGVNGAAEAMSNAAGQCTLDESYLICTGRVCYLTQNCF